MDEMGETGKSTRLLTYGYDKRGNLIKELEGDTLLHGYTYNAGNRLAHAWNHKGEEAFYTYNGLGQRVGRRTSIAGEEETETYLLDFTRPYHNLLGIEKGNSRKTFYWDGNVIGMEEDARTTKGMHYYLLDELGSPLRVSGYAEGDKPAYLTYGYDEFGNDLYEDLEEAGIPNPYSRQGEEQPFGYTGYRYDNISHSYFAQAREYQPENGRFNAEDVIKGNGAFPETLNHYGYCLNNPMGYVDANGMEPELPVFEPLVPETEQEKPVEFPVFSFNEETETDKKEDIYYFLDPNNLPEGDPSRVQKTGEVEIICISWSSPGIIYVTFGGQVVFDEKGNWELQFNNGSGIRMGSGGGFGISYGQLEVSNVDDVEGLGTEAGAAFGIGFSGITAWDKNGYAVGTGEMISIPDSIDGSFEAHIGVSWTSDWETVKKHIIDFFSNFNSTNTCID